MILQATYKMGRTKWEIFSIGEDQYFVFKNEREFHTTNGHIFRTETEAEINIMLEYRVH